jgi:hypothetical protein
MLTKESEIGTIAALGPVGGPPQSKYERLIARAKEVPAVPTPMKPPTMTLAPSGIRATASFTENGFHDQISRLGALMASRVRHTQGDKNDNCGQNGRDEDAEKNKLKHFPA